jgi:hypothetical protein
LAGQARSAGPAPSSPAQWAAGFAASLPSELATCLATRLQTQPLPPSLRNAGAAAAYAPTQPASPKGLEADVAMANARASNHVFGNGSESEKEEDADADGQAAYARQLACALVAGQVVPQINVDQAALTMAAGEAAAGGALVDLTAASAGMGGTFAPFHLQGRANKTRGSPYAAPPPTESVPAVPPGQEAGGGASCP